MLMDTETADLAIIAANTIYEDRLFSSFVLTIVFYELPPCVLYYRAEFDYYITTFRLGRDII